MLYGQRRIGVLLRFRQEGEFRIAGQQDDVLRHFQPLATRCG